MRHFVKRLLWTLPTLLGVAVVIFFVLRAMGELLLSNLNYKSFVDFAADLLGPAAGFFIELGQAVVDRGAA